MCRQLAQGDTLPQITFIVDPLPDALLYVWKIGGHIGLTDSIVRWYSFRFLHAVVLYKGVLHLLIEQDVVLVAAIEIDVERYGRENPQEHIFVGQESEQGAAHTETYRPISKYGEPAYVGPDVVGVRVFEHPDGPVIGAEQTCREEQAIDSQPGSEGYGSPRLNGRTVRILRQSIAQHRKDHPHRPMLRNQLLRDVTVVEQGHHSRTEQPVTEKVGRQVHQYSGIQVPQSDGTEEVYRIIGSQDEQGRTH